MPRYYKSANQHSSVSSKELFVKDSKYRNRHRLKTRVIKSGQVPYECFKCKNPGEWQGKKLTLVLDHINGVKLDHRLSNLRFVCPNCDSQLPTYKSRNIKYQKDKTERFNLSGYDPNIYKSNE